ncbi:hypothetical protein CDAR_79631, partial [Caerostris darwini]
THLQIVTYHLMIPQMLLQTVSRIIFDSPDASADCSLLFVDSPDASADCFHPR